MDLYRSLFNKADRALVMICYGCSQGHPPFEWHLPLRVIPTLQPLGCPRLLSI
eukprot:jgi/Botrbrau1/7732/Bobra.0159s0163.1